MESTPAPTKLPLASCALGFFLGAVVVGACWLTTSRTPASVENVTVDYMYETDPNTAEGSGERPVASLVFHPGYVVITDAEGRGSLFAVDRLRRFSFRPTTAR